MTDTPPVDDERFDEVYDDVLDEDGEPVPPADLDAVIAQLSATTGD